MDRGGTCVSTTREALRGEEKQGQTTYLGSSRSLTSRNTPEKAGGLGEGSSWPLLSVSSDAELG